MHKLLFASLAFGLLVLPVVVILAPGTATGTSETMKLLPAFNKYQCGLCHTSTTPILGAADLNVFGNDFKNNGNVWDRTLADMNSDDDRCLNGFELGDQDGDGVFDGSGEVLEHSNPADPNDCNIIFFHRNSVTKSPTSVVENPIASSHWYKPPYVSQFLGLLS